MYLDLLADRPLDRLDAAFQRAVRECRFMPTIAELREFESQVEVAPAAIEAAYERRKQQILAAPEPKMLKSVLDEPKPKPPRGIRELTEAEKKARFEELRRQAETMKR